MLDLTELGEVELPQLGAESIEVVREITDRQVLRLVHRAEDLRQIWRVGGRGCYGVYNADAARLESAQWCPTRRGMDHERV